MDHSCCNKPGAYFRHLANGIVRCSHCFAERYQKSRVSMSEHLDKFENKSFTERMTQLTEANCPRAYCYKQMTHRYFITDGNAELNCKTCAIAKDDIEFIRSNNCTTVHFPISRKVPLYLPLPIRRCLFITYCDAEGNVIQAEPEVFTTVDSAFCCSCQEPIFTYSFVEQCPHCSCALYVKHKFQWNKQDETNFQIQLLNPWWLNETN